MSYSSPGSSAGSSTGSGRFNPAKSSSNQGGGGGPGGGSGGSRRHRGGNTQSSSSTSSKNALREAVNSVVNSFAKHTQGLGPVDAVEALREFWQMKQSKGYQYPQGPNPLYSFDQTNSPSVVAYVVLPGGACFASFENCNTQEEAKVSAAKVALMNSVFNEHPYRKITPEFISSAVQEALKTHNGPPFDAHNPNSSVGVFKYMLETHIGKTMLEFQEMMTIFRLLHWNDSLKAMRARKCTRQEVLHHFYRKPINDQMRMEMAQDWVSREQELPGVIKREMKTCLSEIYRERRNGKELRFLFEKQAILSMSLGEIQKLTG